MTPYALSYFDGQNLKHFYETDYKNSKDMIKTALSTLFIRKYHQHKVYIHNLSNFDVIFLFQILIEISDDIKYIFKLIYLSSIIR